MTQKISLDHILSEKLTADELLKRLRERIGRIHEGKTPRERGQAVWDSFPGLARDTLRLADQALKGMLILPGTDSKLRFVGNPPEWEETPGGNNEYTFHLNRMHHLKTLAEAYSLSGNLSYARKALEELEDWITTVPCPSLFSDSGEYAPVHFDGLTPWRALEVGIRGYRTWPIIIELLADTPFFTPELLEKIIRSVWTHCEILYRISPLLWPKADHNHYLMENLGLMSFSLLFPELRDSGTYLAHSQRELNRCMEAQCTACGGQIEGCPSYHNGCVFWFAMRVVFARKFGLTVPESYISRLKDMFRHSVTATRPCGGNYPWGDSHIYKETMSLAAVACYMACSDAGFLRTALYFYPEEVVMEDIRDNLWRIPDPGTLRSIMDQALTSPAKPSLPTVAWQKDLNQAYVRSGWEKDAAGFMTACRTPIQNLHAHIDPGGFDFVAFGEPLVTDPGIYTYRDGEERKAFKSAFRHNCLTLNGRNMWEYRASWDYGPQKEGRIVSVTEQDGLVSVFSRHHNYDPAVAERCLSLADGRFLILIDQVYGLSSETSVQIHFHLDRTDPEEIDRGLITRTEGRPNVELIWEVGMKARREAAKISTAVDVWHDSTVVSLHNVIQKGEIFRHASLIIPHRAHETDIFCENFVTRNTDEGYLLSFTLQEKDYRFLWDGSMLHRRDS